MTAQHEAATSRADRKHQLHQLAHDIQSPLSAICMGLEVLKGVRDNEQRFTQMIDMMKQDSVPQLTVAVTRLVDAACREEQAEEHN